MRGNQGLAGYGCTALLDLPFPPQSSKDTDIPHTVGILASMSWDQYLSIVEENRRAHREAVNTPPRFCPNDGTKLTKTRGVYHCPFDGWIWDKIQVVA